MMQKIWIGLCLLMGSALPLAGQVPPGERMPATVADSILPPAVAQEAMQARSYFRSGHYAAADVACQHWIADCHTPALRKWKADAYRLQSQIDSAQGQYGNAMAWFEKYISLRDSLFNEKQAGEQKRLEAKETISRQPQIRNRADLPPQAGNTGREDTHTLRNLLLLAGILLLLFAMGIRYRRRHKTVPRADEVNGVTVISSPQSASLQSPLSGDAAVLLQQMQQAVKGHLDHVVSRMGIAPASAQARTEAFQVIHGQLLQHTRSESIEISQYIRELVASMRASFQDIRPIAFVVEVPTLQLPVSQAVPLGLIVNEVVTNAIKYAFTDRPDGQVMVQLQPAADGLLVLSITDNGQGLPIGFDRDADTSFGMQLIQTLVRQLKGRFDIVSDGGVTVRVTFRQKTNGPETTSFDGTARLT